MGTGGIRIRVPIGSLLGKGGKEYPVSFRFVVVNGIRIDV